jgi:hypothetical protein
VKSDDQLPRVFQANLDRLFQRVMPPAMDVLAVQPTLQHGEAHSMDEFQERASAQVTTTHSGACRFRAILEALDPNLAPQRRQSELAANRQGVSACGKKRQNERGNDERLNSRYAVVINLRTAAEHRVS